MFQFDSCVGVCGIAQSGDCISLASVWLLSRVGLVVSPPCFVMFSSRAILVRVSPLFVSLLLMGFRCVVWAS